MIPPVSGPTGRLAEPAEPEGSAAIHQADELASRYRAYRRRQAIHLLHLMPRSAVRPLYRRALAALPPDESPFEGDPLALLADHCGELLPLPPLEVWRDDLLRHPEGHLRDLEESVHGPTAEAPATLEARSLRSVGRRWRVLLRTFREGDAWRGFMVFEDQDGGASHRTAPVFREGDPLELRERFRSFDLPALEAFLRSARP